SYTGNTGNHFGIQSAIFGNQKQVLPGYIQPEVGKPALRNTISQGEVIQTHKRTVFNPSRRIDRWLSIRESIRQRLGQYILPWHQADPLQVKCRIIQYVIAERPPEQKR